MRPLLLVDIDGVLSPDAAPSTPAGFVEYDLDEYQVWLAREHGEWLRALADDFDLVWATSWEGDANRLLCPLLGLPELPVVEFRTGRAGGTWKLPAVVDYVGDRPFAWLDDELGRDADGWAASRRHPTLLLRVDPVRGLTSDHVARLRYFAAEVARGDLGIAEP